MGRIFFQEWIYFKKDYLRPFLWVMAFSIGFAVIMFFALLDDPSTTDELMKQLMVSFQLKGLQENMSQVDMFWLILKNNLYVSLIMVLIGLIPIYILPAASAILTSYSVALLLAYTHLQGGDIIEILLFGILPHGGLEIMGLFLTSSIGIYLSSTIAKKIFSRNRAEISVKKALLQSFRSYLLLVVPFITIAAIIEGFVTPNLLSNVLQ